VVKLDRLGRNTRDVLNLVHKLEEKGASLRVLEPAIDTGGPMGRMVLTVLGMVAEMELGFIRDRQRAGIDAAKAKGVYNPNLTFSGCRTKWPPTPPHDKPAPGLSSAIALFVLSLRTVMCVRRVSAAGAPI
jgi:DNA invertase Pin-like site-specific DNA recombinase